MNLITENIFKFLLLILLLIISAFFSGSETALFSLTPTDLNRFRKSGGLMSNSVLTLHKQLPEFLLTVLFGNMVVNILFFSISGMITVSIQNTWGGAQAAFFGVGALFMLILCGEVTPKTIASSASFHFSLLSALPMLLVHKTLIPARAILRRILNIIERVCNFKPHKEETDEELKLLFELGQSKGDISRDENGLLNAIIDLPTIKAGEIMTPRVDIVSVNSTSLRKELLEIAIRLSHSKVLLRDNQSDEFIGWVDAREAFLNLQDGDNILQIKRKLLILSEFDRGDQILAKFMETRYGLALVVDERGSAMGIIALSDLAGEIFGELGDEDSRPVDLISNDGTEAYIIDSSLSVREWKSLFNIDQPYPGISTMGGMVTALLGRPAKVGDHVKILDMTIEVLELRKKRPGKLRLHTKQNPETEQC